MGMHMRPSRVLRKLRRGELVSCFMIKTSSAVMAEIAAFSGFDINRDFVFPGYYCRLCKGAVR